ncbi:MAG: YceI family protein [Anaerolineae bacterium]|nr:YceI family protein [Anaerolineae bacterium]
MSRRNLNILGILILMGISSAISIFAYVYIIGGSGEPSGETTAPTLSVPTPNLSETQVAVLSTQVAELSAANATLIAGVGIPGDAPEATVEPTTEVVAEATEIVEGAAPAAVLYRIVQDESQVSFTLTEDLRGVPTTVVGTTNQLAGDIVVDFTTPANSQIGQIRINARTIVTNNEFRNRAIRGEILESSKDEYEFIEFTPTAVTGLPAAVTADETITFQITGDLKIRNITQSVTFDVTATTTEERLEGTATTVVTRTQYNLVIPSAPGVANVSEEVTLQIDFVATRVQ